jgi:hypothetical protein
MWIDQHPFVFAYLLGCALVVLVAMFNMTLFYIVAWITKANVLRKNLKKLEPKEEQQSFAFRAALYWVLLYFKLRSRGSVFSLFSGKPHRCC